MSGINLGVPDVILGLDDRALDDRAKDPGGKSALTAPAKRSRHGAIVGKVSTWRNYRMWTETMRGRWDDKKT